MEQQQADRGMLATEVCWLHVAMAGHTLGSRQACRLQVHTHCDNGKTYWAADCTDLHSVTGQAIRTSYPDNKFWFIAEIIDVTHSSLDELSSVVKQ